MRIADISSNNDRPINLRGLTDAGITGLMVKATEGTSYTNDFFGLDYEAGIAAGMTPGAYHFDHWTESVTAQLSYFAKHYGRRAGDLAPWWDLENYRDPGGVWRILGRDVSWPDVAYRCKIALWCLAVAYGDAIIYCSRDTAANLRPFGLDPMTSMCVAQGSTGPMMGARIMQFSPANIPGVSGLTDWSAS